MLSTIENEHAHLVQQVQCLHRPTGLRAIIEIFFLHTIDEEESMTLVDYPHRLEHIKAHEEVLTRLKNISETTPIEFMRSELLDTIEKHIRDYDEELLVLLRNKSIM